MTIKNKAVRVPPWCFIDPERTIEECAVEASMALRLRDPVARLTLLWEMHRVADAAAIPPCCPFANPADIVCA